jgi:phosphatidylglycerol:prolipoprotein diacylglycerol transferase
MYSYIEIFGASVPMYWLSSVVGLIFAAGLALLRRRAARFQTSAEDVFFTILCCLIGALIGAKLFQFIGFIIRDGGDPGFWTLAHWKGMLPGVGVFYGGLLGGLAAAMIYIHVSKLDFWDVADIVAPSVLLFHAFGRLGCFFAGCCYGREAAWGIAFSHSLNAPNGVPFIPVQLFEAGLNLLVLCVMLILRPERKRPGILLPLYLIAYAIGRFILEFFRGDAGRGVFLLSISQWLSLLVLPAGIVLICVVNRHAGRAVKKEIEIS